MPLIIRKGVAYGTGDTNLYSTAPIGSVLAFAGTEIPDTWLLCDGTSLDIANYPDLYKVIGTTYGNADDTHFNLPDYRGRFIEGTPSGQTVGTNVEAGLPNITGEVSSTSGNGASGAIAASGSHVWAYSSGANGFNGFTFDASRSSSIYGNSTTVQPPAVYGNYIIKAKATATSTNPLDQDGDSEKDYLITTRAEWNALSAGEKAKYDGWLVAFIEDVNAGFVMDSAVVQGSENPVSGNAVYEAIEEVDAKTFGTPKQKNITNDVTKGEGVSNITNSSIKVVQFAQNSFMFVFEPLRFVASSEGGYVSVAKIPMSVIGANFKVTTGTAQGTLINDDGKGFNLYITKVENEDFARLTLRTPVVTNGSSYYLVGNITAVFS